MADESLRALERSLAGSPANAGLRVQLARALVRAGRARDALARLDLPTIEPAFFDDARALADALWRDELARLERRTVIPVGAGAGPDQSDSALVVTEDGLAGWRADLNRGGRFAVVDLERGAVLHESEEFHVAMAIFASARHVFVDEISPEGRATLAFSRAGTERAPAANRIRLVDVAPGGDRFAEWNTEGTLAVRAWPDQQLLHAAEGHEPLVDWEVGVAFMRKAGRHLAVRFGGEPRELDFLFRQRLGRGVYAETGSALILHAWPGLEPIRILEPANDPVPAPSLASDRRVLRIMLGGRPRRFEVDFERGAVVRAPEDKERLSRLNAETGRWHPHADAVFRYRKDRLVELVTPEERLLVLPPGTWPRAWSPDGHSLIAVSSEKGERRLEVWTSKS